MKASGSEAFVERRLGDLCYRSPGASIIIERRQSDLPSLKQLLEKASRHGQCAEKPAFLIRSSEHADFLILIECRADPRRHVSPRLNRCREFAVDGVLLQASQLAREYNVIAIAVSGEDEAHLRISQYLHVKGELHAVELAGISDIISFEAYYQAFLSSVVNFRQDHAALLDYGRSLNHELQARKVTESERAFLISGILIALRNAAFLKNYRMQRTSRQLGAYLLNTIRAELARVKLPRQNHEELYQAFSFMTHQPALIRDREYFIRLIESIDDNINSFLRSHAYYDAVGQFHVEFLRYANNDKGLGIVLTPPHVAELFVDLAGVNRNSIVYDNCCGTGGLLIAALKAMIRDAGADERLKKRIHTRQILGIEFQSKICVLGIVNMMLHGNTSMRILRGDCFEDAHLLKAVQRPTVGLLNPPYKNRAVREDHEELEFVLNNLDLLDDGGVCFAIVPITCATAPSGTIAECKRKLLEQHTLEAVMSMPIELFHNSNTTVVTCVMVFTAHRPHPAGKKSWFGYWRDDGFIKTRHRGRIDASLRWPAIRSHWLSAYRNREVIPGFSVLKEVGPHDEWCAEAYLEIDYSKITRDDLLQTVKKYALNRVMLAHEARMESVHDEG